MSEEGDYEDEVDDENLEEDDGLGDEEELSLQEGIGKDGLADMISRILNQQTADDVPVLAKRKTAIMKG
jgi:hypothetical protein